MANPSTIAEQDAALEAQTFNAVPKPEDFKTPPDNGVAGYEVPASEPLVAELGGISDLLPAVVTETKAGYKTTEFWFSVVAVVLVWVGAVPTPHDAKGFVVAGVSLAYAIARGIAKAGQPHLVEPAAPLNP